MKFQLVEAEKAEHPVSLLCTLLGVTRAGYYAWRGRAPSRRERQDRELERLIRRVFADSHETYGAPRVHAELKDEHDLRVSRKRVARLMRQLGLEGVSRRGKRRLPARAASETAAAPDLVRRDFRAQGPDRLWVADITYIPTWEGFLFLACVVDAWSRRCVGWSMRNDLRSELVIDALGMALQGRRPNGSVIHHSDRGSQYTSLAFGKTLSDAGVLPSMGRRGDAFDNALMESFFATLETELIDRYSFRTRDQARLELFHYLEGFYNPRRRHSALSYLSPERYEERMMSKRDERRAEAVAV